MSKKRNNSCSSPNIGAEERATSLLSGLVMVRAAGIPRSLGKVMQCGIGASLIYRALTGHCGLYSLLGIDRTGKHRGINVHRSVVIHTRPETVYRFWRDFQRLPSIMTHLKSIEKLDEKTSRWTIDSVIGDISWTAELTADEPGQYIAWRSLPGGDIETLGSVQFLELADNITEVKVHFRYNPPGGRAGAALAGMFGHDPAKNLTSDLRRLRQLLEDGETAVLIKPTSTREGSERSSSFSSAQPENLQ